MVTEHPAPIYQRSLSQRDSQEPLAIQDRSSIGECFDSWPAIAVAICVCVGLAYVGWLNVVGRVLFVIFCGIYFGYLLRGTFASRLREQYPNARFIALLGTGLVAAMIGVMGRMVFPQIESGFYFDLAWIAVSFVSILSFVILNRHDPDVLN